MLEAELTEQLGCEKYEAKDRNSGNSRNGKTSRKLHTSKGDLEIEVPRDRNGEFQSKMLTKHQTNTNELEAKVLALCAKGLSDPRHTDQAGRPVWGAGLPDDHQQVSKRPDRLAIGVGDRSQPGILDL